MYDNLFDFITRLIVVICIFFMTLALWTISFSLQDVESAIDDHAQAMWNLERKTMIDVEEMMYNVTPKWLGGRR